MKKLLTIICVVVLSACQSPTGLPSREEQCVKILQQKYNTSQAGAVDSLTVLSVRYLGVNNAIEACLTNKLGE